MTNPPSIAIVGGGLSGLYAAYLLHQKAIPFTVYEARNRLGGRINTHAVPQQSHHQYQRYDLGPTWFWPEMHPHMQQLISQLSLTAFHNITKAVIYLIAVITSHHNIIQRA